MIHSRSARTHRRSPRRMTVILLLASVALIACSGQPRRAGPSNDLLVVGYDREPDTMNRFSTHILEDIQTCIVEGLTVTDEQMRVVPLLARDPFGIAPE